MVIYVVINHYGWVEDFDYEMYSTLKEASLRCAEIEEEEDDYCAIIMWELDSQKTVILYDTGRNSKNLVDYDTQGRDCGTLTAWRYPTLADNLGDPTKEKDLIEKYLRSKNSNYEKFAAVDRELARRKREVLFSEKAAYIMHQAENPPLSMGGKKCWL